MFLVHELEIYIPGAVSTDPTRPAVRFQISPSGPVYQKHATEESIYLSRALSLIFQYNLDTGMSEKITFELCIVKIQSLARVILDTSNVFYPCESPTHTEVTAYA